MQATGRRHLDLIDLKQECLVNNLVKLQTFLLTQYQNNIWLVLSNSLASCATPSERFIDAENTLGWWYLIAVAPDQTLIHEDAADD